MISLSKRLKDLRSEHGLTQEALAQQLIISREYLSRLENGHEPSERLLRAVDQLEADLRKGKLSHDGSDKNPQPKLGSDEQRSSDFEKEARRLFEEAVVSAAGDPARLGWIVIQLRRHLLPTPDWDSPMGTAARKAAHEAARSRKSTDDASGQTERTG